MMLTGPGKTTFAIGAALMSMPLLIFWGLVDRLFRQATRATVSIQRSTTATPKSIYRRDRSSGGTFVLRN